jgi:hypothetical protein
MIPTTRFQGTEKRARQRAVGAAQYLTRAASVLLRSQIIMILTCKRVACLSRADEGIP